MTSYDANKFQGPILVTLAYFLMYYAFLFFQSGLKFYLYFKAKNGGNKDSEKPKVSFSKIKYQSTERLALVGDRSVGNTLEQLGPFIVGLWLYAVFVSTSTATTLGFLYLIFRLIYPLCFWFGIPWIFISTIPGYAIISWFFISLYIQFLV